MTNPKETSVEALANKRCLDFIKTAQYNSAKECIEGIYLKGCEDMAQTLIDSGIIFREDAVKYVEICKECYGVGIGDTVEHVPVDCESCQGRGVVLKGEK